MNPHDDDRLRRHLAGLPEPAPPAGLFSRIERSRTQRRRRRQLLRGGAVLALLLAALLPLRGLREPAPASAVAPDELASLLQAEPDAAALRRIDRQLQAAYDRGADADTLHRLWLARERAAAHALSPENANASVISL